MQELNLKGKFKETLNDFVNRLKSACGDNLVSVILYGSASSGEFISKHSNLNVLVVLADADLRKLNEITPVINKWKFSLINPLFFSEAHIKSSNDVFPIEFLDIQENYSVCYGKDALKNILIDTSNLRFQCEQELKEKLIYLRQSYIKFRRNRRALSTVLFKSFNSILHILRNALRIKGIQPPYLKDEIIKELDLEFQINKNVWEKILSAKNKQVRLSTPELLELYINFVADLESVTNIIDRF